jgi:sugar phosphate isomerase/epimerase
MEIGFCSIAYRHQKMSVREIFQRVASCGYEQIEIWGNHLQNTSLEEIYSCLCKFSLKPSMISPYFNFTDGDKRWKISVIDARRYIDFAANINCRLIRFFTGRKGSRSAQEKNWHDCLEGIKITADIAQKYNINIVIETHADTLADSYWAINRLIKETNRENVGINFDVYNIWENEGNFTWEIFKKVFPYIKHVHLKNAKSKSIPSPFSLVHRKNADLSTICLLEEGEIDYRPYLNYLKGKNFKGSISVEWFGTAIETAAQRDLNYLKTFFQ